MNPGIRALIVDDSAFMRRVITDILESDPEIEVVGTARNGKAALKKIDEIRPDVVTMDVEMPGLNGLETLSIIMEDFPTPVVMLSAFTERGRKETIEALERGAVDFIAKPSGPISINIGELKEEILGKIKVAFRSKAKKFKTPKHKSISVRKFKRLSEDKLVVIGASTGGPQAIVEIFSRLPRDTPACFLIVQHMPPGFTTSFANRLNSKSSLWVKEAQNGDSLHHGTAYVAPGDYHMIVKNGSLSLTKTLRLHGVRPAIDFTMESAAIRFGDKVVGVLLTGMGMDGAAGMKAIKDSGGVTIAQDEASSLVYGMPQAAIKLECVDRVCPLERIPVEILKELEVSS